MYKFDARNSAGTFPTAGDYGKCQKSTFYTLKAPIRKINILFGRLKPIKHFV